MYPVTLPVRRARKALHTPSGGKTVGLDLVKQVAQVFAQVFPPA